MTILRKFIGRVYVTQLFKTDEQQRQMFTLAQEAESALDLLAQRVRESAKSVSAVDPVGGSRTG